MLGRKAGNARAKSPQVEGYAGARMGDSFGKMRQQIKVTTSVAIQLSIKQKQKHYHIWPLVRRPDGGSHRWLMRACERERAPSLARTSTFAG